MFFIALTLFLTNTTTYHAETKKVILGGESIGLQLSTGVYVTGKFDVNGVSPWEKTGVENGDIIISLNNIEVNSISEISNIVNKAKPNSTVPIIILRDDKKINSQINVYQYNGKNTIGLYVKDMILGVGTLTYIDPTLNQYGALGHAMTELAINSGVITTSSVNSIRKSLPGIAGEKRATILNRTLGTININSDFGVFGKYNAPSGDLIEVCEAADVVLGPAQIVTVLNGTEKEYFDVMVVEAKLQSDEDVKGIKIKIIDDELIAKTGGIIQGMSGSPIVQNGKLIGAVSHVIVDNPLFGYGVYAEWMLKTQRLLK